jgi:lysophospholipase L1-like esterase
MLECLILGDSIAVGTHQVRTECVAYAKGGINSWQWNKTHGGKDLAAKTVIISLGSNDHQGVKTRYELERIRNRITADRVYWILPAIKPDIQEIVEDVANQHRDWIIRIPDVSKDGIHPTGKGYRKIGEITK